MPSIVRGPISWCRPLLDSEQRLLQNEVFQAVFDRYYQGENQEAFVQMVKNFTGQRKNLTLFKEQVYQIYDFLQSTSDPEKWLEEHFLKGYEETDFEQVEGDLMESIQQALYEAESPMKAKHLVRPNIWKL